MENVVTRRLNVELSGQAPERSAQRGVRDILVAVVDAPKGFPRAIEAAFPQARVQTRIVHLPRHSMSFASHEDRKAVAAAPFRTRGHFPSDDAAAKLIHPAVNATLSEWKRSVREWHAVKGQLAITFKHRFPMA